jgi:hypothetical protein
VSRLQNHETTDEGMYFVGWGWELYSQYELREKIWLTGGWNYLRPDSDRSAGDYLFKYGVIGLGYSKDGFQNMVYANVITVTASTRLVSRILPVVIDFM